MSARTFRRLSNWLTCRGMVPPRPPSADRGRGGFLREASAPGPALTLTRVRMPLSAATAVSLYTDAVCEPMTAAGLGQHVYWASRAVSSTPPTVSFPEPPSEAERDQSTVRI